MEEKCIKKLSKSWQKGSKLKICSSPENAETVRGRRRRRRGRGRRFVVPRKSFKTYCLE
jgi:hypothetical protein